MKYSNSEKGRENFVPIARIGNTGFRCYLLLSGKIANPISVCSKPHCAPRPEEFGGHLEPKSKKVGEEKLITGKIETPAESSE